MSQQTRHDGRSAVAPRTPTVQLGFQRNPEGSVLYRCGETTVLVSVSLEEGVRDWLRGQGKGWITAEYAMHPRANPRRQSRDGRKGRLDGRSSEIQRLIGRALRSAVHLERLGERTIHIDCDVLDADGGTRTASITAGFIGLAVAIDRLRRAGQVPEGVLTDVVAAISVGWVDGRGLVDLNYKEDSGADVDLNVVATRRGAIVEVQGTAEGPPIPRPRFHDLLNLAVDAIPSLVQAQEKVLADADVDLERLVAPPEEGNS